MMKRFFSFPVGLFLGAALAVGVVVQAEEVKSLIGSTIEGQFPVMVDGETIPTPGIVVGGTSYLPTRTIAELAGFEVSFDADLVINLTSSVQRGHDEEVEQVAPSSEGRDDQPEVSIEYQLERTISEIKTLEMMKRLPMATLRYAESEEVAEKAQSDLDKIEAQIAELEDLKSELEAQLAGTPE